MDLEALRYWRTVCETNARAKALRRADARRETLQRAQAAATLLRDRYGASRVGLFGSVLRDEFDEQSDVDLYVDRIDGPYFTALSELTELFGRNVDLIELHRAAPSLAERIARDGHDLP